MTKKQKGKMPKKTTLLELKKRVGPPKVYFKKRR